MTLFPAPRHLEALDAGGNGGWLRPLAWPLFFSLVFHAAAGGAYFLFMAGRASPVAGWVRQWQGAPDEQPPRLTMTLVVMAAGETEEPAPAAGHETGPTPESPPEAPPAEIPVTESSPLPPTPSARAAEVQEALPSPAPAPVAVPSTLPVDLPQNETAAASVPPQTALPVHAAPSAKDVERHGPELAAAGAALQAAPAMGGRSGGLGMETTGQGGSFTAARLLQPPHLQRFYPYAARRQSITGVTHLVLRVDAAGRVQAAEVTASQPAGVFEQAALRAARALRFEPARRAGQATPADFQLTIEWQLAP